MQKHVYNIGNIVIGGTLESILYAYFHQYKIIYKNIVTPYKFEFIDPHINLEQFLLENTSKKLKTIQKTTLVGLKKERLLFNLIFLMSMNGQIPFSNNVEKISLIDDNVLKVVVDKNRFVKINFNKIHMFDPYIVDGLNIDENVNPIDYVIVDEFSINEIKKHRVDFVNFEYKCPKSVHFDDKIITTVSEICEKELNSFDNSPASIKFFLEDLIDENKWRKSKQRFPIILHVSREKRIKKMPHYDDKENITFCYHTFEELLNLDKPTGYIDNIRKSFHV